MIRKIVTDGDILRLQTEPEFEDILSELNQDEKQYLIGVDYAGLYGKDKSVVSIFTKDEAGNLVLEGTREFAQRK